MDLIDRRQFLAAGATAAGLCILRQTPCACGSAPVPQGELDAGPLNAFAADGVYDALARPSRVLLVRQNGRLVAMSAVCTHRNALLKVKDGQIYCPNHDSHFTPAGTPEAGPAKRPLSRFAIRTDDRGHVLIDTSRRFDEPDWNATGASIEIRS